MLIAFAGRAGAGKDFAARTLESLLPGQDVRHYKIADPIKKFCREVFGWTEDHTDGDLKEVPFGPNNITPRRAMQLLGSDWAHAVDSDCWVRMCLDKIWDDFSTSVEPAASGTTTAKKCYRLVTPDVALITDLRFPNEARAVLDWGGYIIFLDGDGHLEGESRHHVSEQAIQDTRPMSDAVIDNSKKNPTHLRNQLQLFLQNMGEPPRKPTRSKPIPDEKEFWRSW